MQMIKAPNPYKIIDNEIPKIFLAGSIEEGTAEKWQDKVADALTGFNVLVLNPRRDHWDASWKQEKDNPQFSEQVNWELSAQEDADFIVMYFDPNTKSPITLLELGLFAGKKPVNNFIVCCPKGFYRKGNVDIVCDRYNIKLVETLPELIAELKSQLD